MCVLGQRAPQIVIHPFASPAFLAPPPSQIFAFPSTLPCNDSAASGQCDFSAIRSSQHMDCGLWSPDSGAPDYGCNSSFTFAGNIVLLGAAEGGNVTRSIHKAFCVNNHKEVNGLKNMTWGQNVYWSAPLGAASPADLLFATQFEDLNFTTWAATYHDASSIVADPLFRDAANFDFALLPGSPALARGFTPIDTSDVGPRVPWRRGGQ